SIIRIARTEIRSLFYSPIGWLVLIIFIIQAGLDLADQLARCQMFSSLGSKSPGLTQYLFLGSRGEGVLSQVQNRLYLYIPLLTMGLIGRETSSGSIKLLYSSPVSIVEIITGKFLAILSYCLLLISFLLIFVLVSASYLPDANTGLLLSGILGIFLMCVVYSSIGLFMSSLSSYQPVAALYTFAALALLNFIGQIGQNMSWFREVSSFLAIRGRTDQMMRGLISTKQIAYFLTMSALFTGFTYMRLYYQRHQRPFSFRAALYTSLVFLAIGLNWLAARPALMAYFDATRTRSQTITATSQALLKDMPPITVHTYVNILGDDARFGMPAARNDDYKFYEKYQRFLQHGFMVDYTYYYDSCAATGWLFKQHPGVSLKDLAEIAADSKGFDMSDVLSPDSIHKILDLRSRGNRFMRQFVVGDKTALVGIFDDPQVDPGEQEMMDAFKLMTVPAQRVAFLTGHNERVAEEHGVKERDYNRRMNKSVERQSVVNHGFDFRQIDIDSADIPDDISLLIVADPTLPLKSNELGKIHRYIDSGGDCWILGEPSHRELMNPLINPLGVRFMEGRLLAESDNPEFTPDFLITHFAPEAAGYSKVLKQLIGDDAQLTTHGAAGLVYDAKGPFQIRPFIITNAANTWNHIGTFDSTAAKIANDPSHGDQKGAFPIALTLERSIHGKQQRIMVWGDADMLSDGEFSGVPKKLWELNKEIFKWFSKGQFPLDIYHATEPDNHTTISLGEVAGMRTVLLFILPGILLFMGGVLLLIRRRR
ncbi:MAG: Gldg family protein, partial [Bacteroidota bacterium]|nr:Gldg family protein [Bacteroidota bacterium]